jgi:hypothetical protein
MWSISLLEGKMKEGSEGGKNKNGGKAKINRKFEK